MNARGKKVVARVSPILQRLVDWELGWLLLVAPALLFPTPPLALFMGVIPLLWGLRWLTTGHFVPRTPLDGSLLLLLLMVLVSLGATIEPLFSLPKVSGVLLGIALYYALVARANERRGVWQSVFLFVLVACGIAAGSLVGTQWNEKIPGLAPVIKRLPLLLQNLPGSTPEGFNPNSVAGALLFPLPLMAALLWHYRNKSLPVRESWQLAARGAMWLTFLLLAFTLLLTQSRGGYIGLLAGGWALLLLPHRRLALLSGVLLLALLLFLMLGGVELPSPDSASTARVVNSVQDRQEVWDRALYVITDFPLTGVGMGLFRRVVPVLYPWFTLLPDTDIGHPHNHLLAAAVDLGLPGLVAYLALWLGGAAMAWQSWHLALSSDERMLALGLASGLLAHFVWGLADSNVLGSKAGILFWLALAALTSLHRVVTERPLEPLPEGSDV